MNAEEIRHLLNKVQQGKTTVEIALKHLKDMPFKDLGHTKIDSHRELRSGYPEVIYCPGKTVAQVQDIIKNMLKRDNNILATRATEAMYKAVKKVYKKAKYYPVARIISIQRKKVKIPDTYIAVVTAGTSDIPVAEEAAVTAEELGNRVERIFDVGVAGIHRLMDKLDTIRGARVVIVVAGMEGALASVIGGLVDKPVIGVPTAIGYGANFGGISALLGMLTSCANAISVVNIDNGFGAAYVASIINKL
jgi:NCAIR mutase (PurE)-related protein